MKKRGGIGRCCCGPSEVGQNCLACPNPGPERTWARYACRTVGTVWVPDATYILEFNDVVLGPGTEKCSFYFWIDQGAGHYIRLLLDYSGGGPTYLRWQIYMFIGFGERHWSYDDWWPPAQPPVKAQTCRWTGEIKNNSKGIFVPGDVYVSKG